MTKYTVVNMSAAITDMLKELREKKYNLEFRRDATSLYCDRPGMRISPESFQVDEFYYFEETGIPDADRMLCAISLQEGEKGFLIDACNAYLDNISHEMAEKLKLNTI
jgi:hypothetical protein